MTSLLVLLVFAQFSDAGTGLLNTHRYAISLVLGWWGLLFATLFTLGLFPNLSTSQVYVRTAQDGTDVYLSVQQFIVDF